VTRAGNSDIWAWKADSLSEGVKRENPGDLDLMVVMKRW